MAKYPKAMQLTYVSVVTCATKELFTMSPIHLMHCSLLMHSMQLYLSDNIQSNYGVFPQAKAKVEF